MRDITAPFSQFIVKVHSRCDLACDYCYVYTKADQSWRSRPRVISDETVDRAAARIAAHAALHGLDRVHIVLHGGEPLLAGPARLGRVLSSLRDALSGVCVPDIRVHTNGVLLDERFCDLFAEHGVRVGVSVDGDRRAHDRHRRHADGRGSHDQVLAAVELLRSRPELYGGILCTIDLDNDPLAVYEALTGLRPPRIDFLLPHATWDSPPERPPGRPTAYADWLLAIFHRWEAEGRPVQIRLFESIIRTTLGRSSLTEAIGLEPSTLVVIETDGSYEQVDSLKVAYEGAPATGMDVFRHDLEEVARHPGVVTRQSGLAGLSEICRDCAVVDSCGGGLYPHRHRAGSGFANPSVYCDDLYELITEVRGATKIHRHVLPESTLDALGDGLGGARDVQWLAASQRSVLLALIASLRTRAEARAAWEVLVGLESRAPAELRRVLAHPYVRAWAVRCVKGESPARYLANVAAAAALRGGVDVELEVLAHDGAVHLPTVATLGPVQGETAVLTAAAGRLLLDRRDPGRRPARTLRSGTFEILLEDSDPYRDCHQWPVASPLTGAEAAAWQAAFDIAWPLIERRHPAYAEGIRAGLSTLTVLVPPPPGRDASATARQAFGAVAAA
uniref:FxsB family cyclophane-forming radical SAM/SPASM peptide maturase n=1 Tax=Nonomuraea lactucae TaxID=2249762 RepID=UPI001963BC9F